MPFVDEAGRERLARLVDDVGRFYMTDRRMRGAQAKMIRALAGGAIPKPRRTRAYVRDVERYFGRFDREAQARLADVERRLARASQLQFNLAAERGVAAHRVEATHGVLRALHEVARA